MPMAFSGLAIGERERASIDHIWPVAIALCGCARLQGKILRNVRCCRPDINTRRTPRRKVGRL